MDWILRGVGLTEMEYKVRLRIVDIGTLTFASKSLEKHANTVWANNTRDLKFQELGHIEMTILCNVRNPVSLLCSVGELKGNGIR